MKRLLLAVLILWMAVLIIPGLRERADPKVAAVQGWVGDRMEGPMTPVRNRYRMAQVRSHMEKTSRALAVQRNMGMRAPEQDQLRAFLQRHDVVDDGLDPWGTPYILVQEPDSIAIRSAGPDLEHHTQDDIVIRVRYPQRSPARRPFR
jgi:hypothetical protein